MRDCVWCGVCLIDNPILTREACSLKATLRAPSEHVHTYVCTYVRTYVHEHTDDQFGHGGVGGYKKHGLGQVLSLLGTDHCVLWVGAGGRCTVTAGLFSSLKHTIHYLADDNGIVFWMVLHNATLYCSCHNNSE